MQFADPNPTTPPRFLSRPLLWLLFAAAAVLVLGLLATEWWVTRLHNEKELADKSRQVATALQSLDEIQRSSLIDYAVWDDAVRAIRFNYIDWQTDNIGSAVGGVGASADLLVVVRGDDTPPYGWTSESYDVPRTDILPAKTVETLMHALDEGSATPPFVVAQYVIRGGEVWRLMATRVIPNDGVAPDTGDSDIPRLISGVRLSEDYLARITAQTLVEDIHIEYRFSPAPPNWTVGAYTQLVEGPHSAWLRWTTARPGDLTLRSAALPLLTLAIGMVAALGICLRQILRAAHELEGAMHQALQADRAKTEFLATVTHELRTPLNGVLGIGEVLRNTPLSTRQRDMLEVMMRSGRGLLELINDLLDVARIEAGNLELASERVDLAAILSGVDELLNPVAAQRDIALVFHTPPDPLPTLTGDYRALRQVLINLVGNAIKFTREGQVTVTTILAENGSEVEVEFRISDTGQGISPANLDRIFDRFFQENRADARQSKGTGLGLAITQALVSAMNGRIEVESTPGKGSTFRVRISLPRDTNPPVIDAAAMDRL